MHRFGPGGALIKRVVSIPVLLSNRVNDPEMADTLVKMGAADFVAQYRDDVSVLEMRGDLCLDMMPITKQVLMGMLATSGVKPHVNATVRRIETDVEVDSSVSSWSGKAGGDAAGATGYGVVYADAEGVEHTLPAATVISAFGYKAYNPLEEIARRHCDDVRVVGCAVKAGNALVASREGYEAGLAI